MDTLDLRGLIESVKRGELSRRGFGQILLGLGLTTPLIGQMLATSGVGAAQAPPFTPTKRGGGGPLRALWWQGPTLLNPHFAIGTKDQDASRIFYEPLASYDPDGQLVPILAQEIPSLENGAVAKDGKSVTWRLKRGVSWHDGKPFTADDVIFNWEFAVDPTTSALTIGSYSDIEKIEKVDSHTVKILFKRPTPFWSDAFCGVRGMLIPKHLFDGYRGEKSREAPNNLKPVGTGPYKFVDFKPGDLVRGEINPNYHIPNRPFFDTLELKGGGDAASAARAVLQTGEYDYAWNLQVEDDILKRLEQGGKGRAVPSLGGNMEFIAINMTDPNKEVDGERSSLKAPHPFFSDPAVRQAVTLLVDRAAIQEHIYGRTGIQTANFLNAPSRFQSKNTRWEFNIDKANQVLDTAGWKRGADGTRVKDGVKLKLVFATSINAPRQKAQAIVKQACAKAGVDVELKSVVASVFFSSDPANPDTYPHFYTDIQMFTITQTQPDPGNFMNQFVSWEAATKANKWQGRNITRWRNEEYDRLYRAAETELDSGKRAGLFIRMNEIVINNFVAIPLVWRPRIAGVSNTLRDAVASGWDSDFWHLPYWYRQG